MLRSTWAHKFDQNQFWYLLFGFFVEAFSTRNFLIYINRLIRPSWLSKGLVTTNLVTTIAGLGSKSGLYLDDSTTSFVR